MSVSHHLGAVHIPARHSSASILHRLDQISANISRFPPPRTGWRRRERSFGSVTHRHATHERAVLTSCRKDLTPPKRLA